MRRFGAVWILLAAAAGTIAYACADVGYGGSWEAKASSAILSPANDTRTNLLLLLADRQGSATANPATMAQGIIPIEFPWRVAKGRLEPPPAKDEDRWKNYYSDNGEGTRCQSNDSGSAEFIAAVRATNDIPANEKDLLVTAREALKPTCDTAASNPYMPIPLGSAAGKEFSTYLAGADEFYRGRYDSARSRFASLSGARNGWVRDTALYMVARNELNRAQAASFDEYGSLAAPGQRDSSSIATAGKDFDAYLGANPRGRYANSANGLLRRVAWLKGDEQALGGAYSALLKKPVSRKGAYPSVELIEEIDLKLLPAYKASGVTDPLLLAVIDLVRLRKEQNGDGDYGYGYDAPELERAELEQQQPLFAAEPDLFGYLLAVEALFGRKQPKDVLTQIPDASNQKQFTYLQFSRQMLRGFALDALKDRNARGFWLSLLPGATRPYQREAVELALAEHDGSVGAPDRLLAAGSPVRHPLIRQRVLEEDAGPSLLRQQAQSGTPGQQREVALYLLLAGELHHGLYADFLRDVAMVKQQPLKDDSGYYGGWEVSNFDPLYGSEPGPPPLGVFAMGGSNDLAPCPDIRATATDLAVSPMAIRPRLCLGEFIRRKGFDGWSSGYDAQYRPLSRPRNHFPGQPLERMNIYRSVMSSAAASADDKAFALNRAIRCYAPAGSSSCGGEDVPASTRKAWFDRLKRDYPQSSWARDLKYYW